VPREPYEELRSSSLVLCRMRSETDHDEIRKARLVKAPSRWPSVAWLTVRSREDSPEEDLGRQEGMCPAGSAAGVTRSREQRPSVHHQLLAEWRRDGGRPCQSGERLALGSRMKHQATHTDQSALQL